MPIRLADLAADAAKAALAREAIARDSAAQGEDDAAVDRAVREAAEVEARQAAAIRDADTRVAEAARRVDYYKKRAAQARAAARAATDANSDTQFCDAAVEAEAIAARAQEELDAATRDAAEARRVNLPHPPDRASPALRASRLPPLACPSKVHRTFEPRGAGSLRKA